ncbi:hypothetical protein DFJ74DRAFT_703247 [Hyaloraphidium curvatum]|nr:hypothetical protein DFJ74DRAFT_703247 [Hyaloraphidium curvatum]
MRSLQLIDAAPLDVPSGGGAPAFPPGPPDDAPDLDSDDSSASETPPRFALRAFPRTCVPFLPSYVDTPRSAELRVRAWATRERMDAVHRLLNGPGFAVIPGAFAISDPAALLDPARGSGLAYAPVFQAVDPATGGEGSGDGLRMQAFVRYMNQGCGDLHASLRRCLEALFPGRRMEHVAALRSLPGCKPQPKHTDFVFTTAASRNAMQAARPERDMPLLFMIAAGQGTAIRLWPYSWKCMQKAWTSGGRGPFELHGGGRMLRLRLEDGSVLVFRPDLVHAGDGFEEENTRLHGHLVVPGSPIAFQWDRTNILGRPGIVTEELDRLLVEAEGWAHGLNVQVV